MSNPKGIRTVVVTGASGFIGSHIVKASLQRGLAVRACVRDAAAPKNVFLEELAAASPGTVELYSADLTTEGSFDAACAGAQGVIHAAAQVDPTRVVDPWVDMVEPSTKGVANILGSVDRSPSVVAFVQTSSIAAVGFRAERAVTEADWSTTPIEESPYVVAKRLGEKAVWAATKGKPYTVAAVNPSMVWGPCLAKQHCKASPYVFRQSLYGNPQPNTAYSVVDVRNVAAAHVEALLRPEADGQRFILDGDEPPVAINDVIAKARALFPAVHFADAPGPHVGFYDRGSDDDRATRGGVRNEGSPTVNTRSVAVLGIRYYTWEQTVADTLASMLDSGWVKASPAAPPAKL